MDPEAIRAARQKIQASRNILLLTHVRPDGDALGSLLGLGHMLRAAGKAAFPVLAEGMPSVFRFLPGSAEIQSTPPPAYDLSILLDCADRARINAPKESLRGVPDILIDHHVTNGLFAGVNIVDPEATATAELLAQLAEPLGLSINPEAAVCLLAGVVADTLGFRTPNTGVATLDVVRTLVQAGASLPDIVERSLYRRTFAAARYWGFGLTHLEREGGLVWATLSLAERKAAAYPGRDDADLVNVLSSIDDARAALLFIEQEDGKVKISWRVREGMDATRLAASFGGGGHPAASGASVEGTLDEVRRMVVDATRQWLAGLPPQTGNTPRE
jgi:phosphoesterase RecJ-like protein